MVVSDALEMPADPTAGTMPDYSHISSWVRQETSGLSDEQLDFDNSDQEWMWWSIRRQVSHMAWTALVFPKRRLAQFLWEGSVAENPIVWEHHQFGPQMKYDRMLDADLFWDLEDIFPLLDLGISWLQRVVAEQPIEVLRATSETIHGTQFWADVITVLPRGAHHSAADHRLITYNLEGSLWMVFYELAVHLRTIQRLKEHQGLVPLVDLPRFGYMRLPHYWGDGDASAPPMTRL